MAKLVLDWKTPSEKKIADYVSGLDKEKKISFAKECLEKKGDKNKISKTKAKKWIIANCDEKDIEWKNKPKNAKPMSSADMVASWLNL